MVFLTGSDFVDFTIIRCRLHGLIRPDTCIQVSAPVLQEIGTVHEELHAATALHENDVIPFRNLHQPFQRGYGIILHILIRRTAMTDFYNAHTRMIEIKEFCLDFFQYIQRHSRRPGIKIVHSFQTNHSSRQGKKRHKRRSSLLGRASPFSRYHPICRRLENKKLPSQSRDGSLNPALPPNLPYGQL